MIFILWKIYSKQNADVIILNEEEFKKYLRAGEIASKVMKEIIRIVRPGMLLIEIAEKAENMIRELGGEPAFPINISIGNEAAHYTPLINDLKKIPESGVVKIDLGVHVDGYIADMARSIDLDGRYRTLVDAVDDVLNKILINVKPGISAKEIGRIAETYARRYGFKTVRNLSGHMLDRYVLHAGYNIPNYPDPLAIWRLKNNNAYAIEPFLTTGSGVVSEDKNIVSIYSLKKSKYKTGDKKIGSIIKIIEERFKGLPFCGRWLKDLDVDLDIENMLRSLYKEGVLYGYPLLSDLPGSQVSQAEDTIVIYENQVFVTTRR